mgnify:CR=1 FL=1
MTAMELKCLKMDLVEELLSIDDKDTLNRVKNYLKKLNNKIRTKAERNILARKKSWQGLMPG